MKAWKAFRYVFRFVWRLQQSYIAAVIAMKLFETLQILCIVYFPKMIIDGIVDQLEFSYILVLIAVFCGILFLCRLMSAQIGYVVWIKQIYLQRRLICSVMEKTARIDYENLENPEILDLKRKAEQSYLGDASEEFFGILKYFFSIGTNLITLVGIVLTLFQLGVFPWIILNLIIICNCIMQAKNIKKNFAVEEESIPFERRWQYYRDLPLDLKAIKEIKCFNLSTWIVEKFSTISKITSGFYGKLYKNNSQVESCCAITLFIRDILSYGYIAFLVVRQLITIGSFTMLIAAVENYSNVLQKMIQDLLNSSHVGMFVEYLEQYLNLPERILRQGTKTFKRPPEDLVIEFRHVSFRYPNSEKDALHDVSLTIQGKERLSIVGENGAGKTTLIKLLCRLYQPTSGVILLNGVDIAQYALEDYNRLLSTVFQDFQLFSMSVAENLTLGQEIDLQKANYALKAASLGSVSESRVDFFHREIGKLFADDGLILSGGEQQKFAIARALYREDSRIIVLDEPTAALDPRSEAEIYETIGRLIDQKMSIFISHRLSSCLFCDHIVVLKDGELVEYGSHTELMQQNGLYCELFQIQSKYYQDKEKDLRVIV